MNSDGIKISGRKFQSAGRAVAKFAAVATIFVMSGIWSGCTYVKYGEAKYLSILQSKRLTISTVDEAGKPVTLNYGSGTDPIIVNIPGYGTIGEQGK